MYYAMILYYYFLCFGLYTSSFCYKSLKTRKTSTFTAVLKINLPSSSDKNRENLFFWMEKLRKTTKIISQDSKILSTQARRSKMRFRRVTVVLNCSKVARLKSRMFSKKVFFRSQDCTIRPIFH